MADLSPELMLAATRGPQVETPTESYAKLLAVQNARQQQQIGAQQLQSGALSYRQQQQAFEDEQKYRGIIAANTAQQTPAPAAPPQGGAQQPGAVAGTAPLGADESGMPQSAPAPPTPATALTAPPPGVPVQTAPGTNQPLHTFDVQQTIGDLRKAGLHAQADALAATALKQQLDIAQAGKDTAQGREAQQNALTKEQERVNQAHRAMSQYLINLPDEAAREKAFPYAMKTLIAAGAAHPANADVTYQQYGGLDALKRDDALSSTEEQRLNDAENARKQQLQPPAVSEAEAKAAQARLALKQQQIANAANQLAVAAESKDPLSVERVRSGLSPEIAAPFSDATTAAQFRAIGSTPAEAATQTQQAANAGETARHNKNDEAQGAQRLRIASVEADPFGTLGLNKNPGPTNAQDPVRQAVAGVLPKQVTLVMGQARQAGNDYATAVNAANEMKDIIQLARSGNITAYAYAPTTGVLTINSSNGVKRVNMAEIEQYAGQGSLKDRVAGWFGKQLSGASLDGHALDDMAQVHDALEQNANKTYGNRLKVINETYGSSFKPVDLTGKSAAPPGLKVGDSVNLKNGKTGKVSAVHPDGSFDIQ